VTLLAVGVAVMGTMLWIAGTLWAALLVYNFITALFGINTFRVKYIELLRWLYRSVGMKPMKPTPKNGSMQRQYGDEFADYGMEGMSRVKSFGSFKREFKLDDVCDFVKTGVQVIVDDEVTHRFTTEEVEQWNFLTRTQMQLNMGIGYEILLWLSILFRFGAFFIVRLPIGLTSLIWLFSIMTVFSILNLFVPTAPWKLNAERYCTMVCSRLIAATFTAVINIHNPQNRAKCGSVVVANHTTPIDIVMLAADNCFTLVGQRHGGFTGIIQSACSLAQRHIWFERKVAADRKMVAKRLKEHISEPSNNPILIFPEGQASYHVMCIAYYAL
jgi:glycerol-3-phosphate O-acyltransferase 3/4